MMHDDASPVVRLLIIILGPSSMDSVHRPSHARGVFFRGEVTYEPEEGCLLPPSLLTDILLA